MNHLPSNSAASTATDERDRFEAEYGALGWIKGPHALRADKTRQRQFWASAGAEGAAWLASRLREESHVDVLRAAAEMLAGLKGAAIAPIVAQLRADPTTEQAEALLTALSWIPAEPCSSGEELLAATLTPYLSHDDADLREAAISATAAVGGNQAVQLLRALQNSERNPELSALIAARIRSYEC